MVTVLEIVAVCTGNICRSPLAELLLRTRLSNVAVAVASVGTRTREGMHMPPEAADLAAEGGVAIEHIAAHRSRRMQADHIRSVDLVLAMAREHRREVVELAPARVRNAFTVREFGRLCAEITDADLRGASFSGSSLGDSAKDRFAGMLAVVSARRGVSTQLSSPGDEDVVDPFGRSAETYRVASDQLAPGLHQVERLVRLASS